MKSNVLQLSHRMKVLIKASYTSNIHTGEIFAAATFKGLWRVVSLLWYILVRLSLFCICRRKKTKKILLVRGKRFLYVDVLFDMAKCKFIVKNSSLICWLRFHKKIFLLYFFSFFNHRIILDFKKSVDFLTNLQYFLVVDKLFNTVINNF